MTEYIVVLSGKGGTGKTSVSVALAKTLNAGLLDVDLMGPNVPETLEEDDPERHSIGTGDTIKPAVHDGLEVMSLSYELVDNTVFLQESEFEEKFVYDWINSIDWESDIVVVDSPPGCLVTGTRVWTDDGNKEIQEIEKGDKVMTFGGELTNKPVSIDGGAEYREVSKLVDSGEQEVYELRTNTRKIEATADHPVLCATKESEGTYDLEWKEVQDVEEGDQVLVVKEIDRGYEKKLPSIDNIVENKEGDVTIPDETTPELCKLAGYFLGDGNLTEKTVQIVDGHEENISKYTKLVKELFGYEPEIYDKPDGNADILKIHRKRVAELFRRLSLDGTAHTKRVPDWVYSEPLEHRKAILEGLIDSDGHRRTEDYSDKTRRKGNISFEICNKELAEDVRQLFISIGERPINLRHRERDNPWAKKRGTGKEKADSWSFGVPLEKARDDGGPSKGTPKYRGSAVIRSRGEDGRPGLSDENWGFDGVRRVEKIGKKKTWNLVVEGNHNFMADGIVVHNTDTPTRTILKELPKPYATIVTTGQDSSIQDCRRTKEMINHLNREEDANIQKLGIIENFAYYEPPGWLKKLIEEADEEDLPDDGDTTLPLLGHNNLSKDFELPLLARIPFCHDRVNRRDEVAVAIESLIHQEEHLEIIEVVKESLEYGHKKDNLEDFSIFKEVPDEPEEEEDSEGEADEDGSPKMIPIDEEELTQIEGIGPGYSSRIADEYEDYYDIMVRGAENVSEATGVPEKTIERLKDNIEGGEFVG